MLCKTCRECNAQQDEGLQEYTHIYTVHGQHSACWSVCCHTVHMYAWSTSRTASLLMPPSSLWGTLFFFGGGVVTGEFILGVFFFFFHSAYLLLPRSRLTWPSPGHSPWDALCMQTSAIKHWTGSPSRNLMASSPWKWLQYESRNQSTTLSQGLSCLQMHNAQDAIDYFFLLSFLSLRNCRTEKANFSFSFLPLLHLCLCCFFFFLFLSFTL